MLRQRTRSNDGYLYDDVVKRVGGLSLADTTLVAALIETFSVSACLQRFVNFGSSDGKCASQLPRHSHPNNLYRPLPVPPAFQAQQSEKLLTIPNRHSLWSHIARQHVRAIAAGLKREVESRNLSWQTNTHSGLSAGPGDDAKS